MEIKFIKNEATVSGQITINLVKADYEDLVKKTLKETAKKASIPGFRPGKVPASLIKKFYGTHAKIEAVNKKVEESLFTYIDDNKLNVLGQPVAADNHEAQDIEHQDDFIFVFDLPLAPEFEVSLSADDKVAYYDISVEEKEVDDRLNELRSRAGENVEVEVSEERDLLRGTLSQLNEEGNAPLEGGLVVESSLLMPAYFANKDEAKAFIGAHKNDVVTFNPSKAYEGRDAELAGLFKVSKDEVANYAGLFSFQIDSISRFVPAEVNEEFFKKIYGEDTEVKSEEQVRELIKGDLSKAYAADSDYRLFLDVKKKLMQDTAAVKFPEDLLKKVLKHANEEKKEELTDEQFTQALEELRWDMIRTKLASQFEVKVEDADVKASAIEAARYQFAQYGMNNIPDEYLENFAQSMLKDQNRVNGLVQHALNQKLIVKMKDTVTLEHKTVTSEEFAKLSEAE